MANKKASKSRRALVKHHDPPDEEGRDPCCPPSEPDKTCEVIDFAYRLNHLPVIEQAPVPVEVKLLFRYSRCPGPLAIGNLLYTTTLLPGETVKLFTSDRRSSFKFDSASNTFTHESQTSEESHFSQAFSDSMFDLTNRDQSHSSNRSQAHIDGHADAGVDVLGMGGEASMSGNFNSESTSDFLREMHQHSQSSQHSSEMGTRKASSVSIGESLSRMHTEGESQDHYESASREFSNPNQCHAVTFLFYQINKLQDVKFTIEAVELRAIDPAGDVSRVSPVPREKEGPATVRIIPPPPAFGSPSMVITDKMRSLALEQVSKEMFQQGLLRAPRPDAGVSEEARKRFSWEKEFSLPTPGVLVKGCLDECDICEPEKKREIELALERKRLENELLKRQIELLDKAQEYRCCPGETKPDA